MTPTILRNTFIPSNQGMVCKIKTKYFTFSEKNLFCQTQRLLTLLQSSIQVHSFCCIELDVGNEPLVLDDCYEAIYRMIFRCLWRWSKWRIIFLCVEEWIIVDEKKLFTFDWNKQFKKLGITTTMLPSLNQIENAKTGNKYLLHNKQRT